MRSVLYPLLVLAVVVSGCSVLAPNPCAPDRIEETLQLLLDIDEQFQDAVEIAESAPRMSLAGPLADLQDIRREAEDIDLPECAQEAHRQLITYMDAEIEMLLSFLSQESDAQVASAITTAQNARLEYLETVLILTGEITAEP